MKSDNDLAFDRYASKICQALGVVATMVATKAMREPTDVYKRNLEKDEVAKAPIAAV